MRRAVGLELRRLNNLITREVSKIARDIPFGNVTEMHANMVDYLIEAGKDGVMQKDIEQAFTIRKSTASRILKLMEKNGVIARHGVEYDARLKRITLTEDAGHHYKMMKEYAEDMELRLSAGISQEDMDIFFKVLKKMQSNLES